MSRGYQGHVTTTVRSGQEDNAGNKEVILDLHGLTVVETNVVLSREFKALRESYEAARALRRTKMGEESVEGDDDGLRDMIIITGIGRRSVIKGQSVLRTLVRDYLDERDIHHYQPQKNRGRFIIPRTSFLEYFDNVRKKEQELHFIRLSLYRYLPVASLLVMSMLIPKISGHFPT